MSFCVCSTSVFQQNCFLSTVSHCGFSAHTIFELWRFVARGISVTCAKENVHLSTETIITFGIRLHKVWKECKSKTTNWFITLRRRPSKIIISTKQNQKNISLWGHNLSVLCIQVTDEQRKKRISFFWILIYLSRLRTALFHPA